MTLLKTLQTTCISYTTNTLYSKSAKNSTLPKVLSCITPLFSAPLSTVGMTYVDQIQETFFKNSILQKYNQRVFLILI